MGIYGNFIYYQKNIASFPQPVYTDKQGFPIFCDEKDSLHFTIFASFRLIVYCLPDYIRRKKGVFCPMKWKRNKIVFLSILAAGVLLLFAVIAFWYSWGKRDWQTQFDLGRKNLLQQDYDQAIVCFTQAIAIDPQRYEAYVGRAQAYMAGHPVPQALESARQDYESALVLAPDDPALYLALISLYEQSGDKQEADLLRQQGFAQTGDSRLEPLCTHEWSAANYQEPQTCLLCGETQGEPLAAALSNRSMMAENETYTYQAQCWEDKTRQTASLAAVTRSPDLISDDTHPGKDGYVWKRVTVTVTADDENAWLYGIRVRLNFLDFYTGAPLDSPDPSAPETFMVNYRGQEYSCTAQTRITQNGWNGQVFTWSADCDFLVPEGYDGCTPVLYNALYEPTDDTDFASICDAVIRDENTLFFRIV